MAMTVPLLLRALAHQGNSFAFRKFCEQTQREFLAVIFDGAIATVNGSAFKQFHPVTTSKLRPGDSPGKKGARQGFAGPGIRHPHLVAGGRQVTTAKSGRENSQTIPDFNWAVDGFVLMIPLRFIGVPKPLGFGQAHQSLHFSNSFDFF